MADIIFSDIDGGAIFETISVSSRSGIIPEEVNILNNVRRAFVVRRVY